MFDEQLMKYFKFDEADLQANRSGQLTEKQTTGMAEDDKYNKIFGAIGGIFLFLIAVLGFYVGVSGFSQSYDIRGRLTAVVLVAAWGGLFGGLCARTMRHAFSKFQVRILKAEGPVNIVKVERTSTRPNGTTSRFYAYEMHIGTGTFDVTSDLAGYMMQGDIYAIYYTQDSEKEILSTELISKAK
jgi:hypothetical protein